MLGIFESGACYKGGTAVLRMAGAMTGLTKAGGPVNKLGVKTYPVDIYVKQTPTRKKESSRRKTLIAATAASALAFLGFSTTAFAGNGNHSHNGNDSHNTVVVGSSLLNIGGQGNGAHSVSGVLNEQNVTGNGSTAIYNNASPIIDF
jgi:hypothetical protein